jgi:hypothetical protein
LLSNNANYGLLSHVNHSAANVPIYISGVAGVDSSNSFFSSGIAGFSRSNTTGIGVFGRASKNDPYTLGAGFNSGFMGGGFMGGDVGIFSTAGFAATGVNTDRYAVIGQAFGSGATNAVGIYGTASGATNNWAGIFAGRLAVIDGTQAVGTIFTDDGSGSGTGKWSTPAAAGLVSGTGTLNFIPKWTPSGTVLGNSMIQDNGNGVKIGTSVFYNQNSLNIYPTATSSEPSLLLGDSEVGGLFVAQSTGKLHFAMNNPLIQNGNVVMTIDDDNQQGVGIGTLAPRAKLEVTGEATGTYTFPNGFISHSAIITEQTNAGTTNNGAIAAYANGATNSNFSIVGTVGGSGTGYNAGGGFTSRDASSGTNIGVYAAAQNGASNFAGWFEGAIRIFDGTQGAGKVLTSDATGNASWVNNNYSFSTNSFSAPVSIPSGSTVPITQWNVVNYENGSAGNYNPATGEYTVPVAGVYHIDATIRINGFASDYVVFNLVKNGVNTGVDGTATFGPVVVTVSINTDIQLAAGDKISLSLFNATPAGIATFTNPANKFNVHLIHR